jgi:hypothetical protein
MGASKIHSSGDRTGIYLFKLCNPEPKMVNIRKEIFFPSSQSNLSQNGLSSWSFPPRAIGRIGKLIFGNLAKFGVLARLP